MTSGNGEFPLDEYEAFRSGRGYIELDNWSSVTLTGNDRQTFLHNFCTNDVKRLRPGEQCEAFITNVKGKVLGHVIVTCRLEELVLITTPGQAEPFISHLDRYLIREDVQFSNTTGQRVFLLLAGARDGSDSALWNSPGWASYHLLLWSFTDAPPTTLIEVASAQLPALQEQLATDDAIRCDERVWQAIRMEAFWPIYGIDFDESNLPQEVGRNETAISFTKGCYLGQETVARIDALGHVNRQLTGVRFASANVPAAGTILSLGSEVTGRVTSSSYAPRFGAPLALAMVRREHTAPGSKFESDDGPCEVIALPVNL